MAEEKIICVKHGGNPINSSNFYITGVNSIFSGIGKIPICKNCLYKEVENYYKRNKDLKLSMYLICRKIDVAFDSNIFEGSLKDDNTNPTKVFMNYITQFNSLGGKNGTMLPFDKGEHIFNINNTETCKLKTEIIDDEEENFESIEDAKIFWGDGFDEPYDYNFLGIELANWKKTHKCDNQAEITLLREICIKILEIRKLRELKQSVSKEQKELQDLMKTASVDPAKSNAINSGENVDRFGVWLKDIEQKRPAEWWDDQEKYKDMDGLMPYIKDYITRPIRNFFTGAKDFLVNGQDLSFAEKDGENNE